MANGWGRVGVGGGDPCGAGMEGVAGRVGIRLRRAGMRRLKGSFVQPERVCGFRLCM